MFGISSTQSLKSCFIIVITWTEVGDCAREYAQLTDVEKNEYTVRAKEQRTQPQELTAIEIWAQIDGLVIRF